ncbi:hypothetical protein ACQ0QQ_14030 [Lysinibacillus sphaericus]
MQKINKTQLLLWTMDFEESNNLINELYEEKKLLKTTLLKREVDILSVKSKQIEEEVDNIRRNIVNKNNKGNFYSEKSNKYSIVFFSTSKFEYEMRVLIKQPFKYTDIFKNNEVFKINGNYVRCIVRKDENNYSTSLNCDIEFYITDNLYFGEIIFSNAGLVQSKLHSNSQSITVQINNEEIEIAKILSKILLSICRKIFLLEVG